ncbi:MucB/RseB [gamma proteobacterium HTCC5015]|nr:MucB/RseB [gamma proteobacterium HTCC5015]
MTVRSKTQVLKAFAAGLALLFAPLSLNADDASPVEWLKGMCDAMQNQSYTGTFVYLHGNSMESMRVVRRHTDAGSDEKLVSLNGEPREILRRNNVVTQILPKLGVVTVNKARVRSQLPLSVPMEIDGIERYYQLSLEGVERVAGRRCQVLSLKPRDSYRYGHRLWIDESSRLLIKSDLLDTQGDVLEQIMYTELEVSPQLTDAMFEPEFDTAGLKRRELGHADQQQLLMSDHQWRVSRAPQGFMLTTHERRGASESAAVEHMVYSDGMATVSVFVEPLAKGENMPVEGHSRMGALNAYGRVQGSHKVVVVGEVPAATVKQLSESVEARSQ